MPTALRWHWSWSVLMPPGRIKLDLVKPGVMHGLPLGVWHLLIPLSGAYGVS
jgi:hypothetical protein